MLLPLCFLLLVKIDIEHVIHLEPQILRPEDQLGCLGLPLERNRLVEVLRDDLVVEWALFGCSCVMAGRRFGPYFESR